MSFTILGQTYNEAELRQLLGLRQYFEDARSRMRRGVRSEKPQLPKDALASSLPDNTREVFLNKLQTSALIDQAYSESSFYFNEQRFQEALEKAEEIIAQIEHG